MTPLNTTIASVFAISLIGISSLSRPAGPDNAPAPDGELSFIDDRTTTEIYAEYFPAPELDVLKEARPRIHRNLQTNRVFVTDTRSPIGVQRKFAPVRKVNQTKRSTKRVFGPVSTARTSMTRSNHKLSIVDLARQSFQKLHQNRAKNTVRNKQRTGFYEMRQDVLEKKGLKERALDFFKRSLGSAIDRFLPGRSGSEWDYNGLSEWFKSKFGEAPAEGVSKLQAREQIEEELTEHIQTLYEKR